MEIKYQIFEEENLLFHRFSGEFSFEKYVSYTRNLTELLATKNVTKVLVDLRKLKTNESVVENSDIFIENIEKISNLRRHLNENEFRGRDVILVFWVDEPLPTVVAHLFIQKISKENYSYCSTEKKIISHLKLPKTFNNLNEISENLENTFK